MRKLWEFIWLLCSLPCPGFENAARLAFLDVPSTCAVIVADWSRQNFGQLPFPKWGEVVI